MVLNTFSHRKVLSIKKLSFFKINLSLIMKINKAFSMSYVKKFSAQKLCHNNKTVRNSSTVKGQIEIYILEYQGKKRS